MSTSSRQMLNVEQAHLELIKSLLSEFAGDNLDGVRALLTPDVKLHVPGDNSLSGEYRGVDSSLRLLDRITQWTGGTTRVRLHDVLANEQHGILLYTVTAEHGDRSIRYRYIDLYHFREGKISEVWGYPADDASAFDEFYSE
jgi:ketosteroid isomerase-like protein